MQKTVRHRISKKNGLLKVKTSVLKAVFWLLLFSSDWWLNEVEAGSVSSHEGIVLTGEVLISSEYIFLLRKNSSIEITQWQDSVSLEGVLRGFEGIPQAGQKLSLHVIGKAGEVHEAKKIFTGSKGEFSFSFQKSKGKSVEVRVGDSNDSFLLEVLPLFTESSSRQSSFLRGLLTIFP